MLERIWEILRGSETLLDEAWRDAEKMLVRCERMYEIVSRALRDEASEQVLSLVAQMDREVNDQQREIRKKVFQQLALGRGGDLLRGLQLTVIVIDLERIGDYTKNIGELSELLKGRTDFGEAAKTYEEIHEMVTRMFALSRQAIGERSAEKGRAAMDLYPKVSRRCDRALRDALSGSEGDEPANLDRSDLVFVLLLRYMKRVAAHLKNACSAIVNPFHQIGFRDGLG